MIQQLSIICKAAAILTLAIASFHDLKDRSIPDSVWIPGMALGFSVKILDYSGTIEFLSKTWYFLFILFSLLTIEWKFRLSGEADILAYLTLATLLTGNRMFPDALMIYFLSKIFIILMIPVQFLVNVVRVIRDPGLLRDFDEPIWRKFLALMLLSPYDRRLATCASVAEVSVSGKRKFSFKAALRTSCDEAVEGKWIAPTYPAMPMILTASLTVILAP